MDATAAALSFDRENHSKKESNQCGAGGAAVLVMSLPPINKQLMLIDGLAALSRGTKSVKN